MAATREQQSSYLCNQWIKFNDVNINFIYFEVNGFIGLSWNMIRVIYFMFGPFLAFLRQQYIETQSINSNLFRSDYNCK